MGDAKSSERPPRTLYIKNPAAHRLAEEVGQRLGVNLSDAVIAALEEKLQNTGRPINRDNVESLCAELAALPVLDHRSADEILGYDSFGIPR